MTNTTVYFRIRHSAAKRRTSVTIVGDTVTIGRPVPLFRLPADAGGWGANWTANADHTRFVVVDAPHGTNQTIRVLTNWR